MPLLFVNIIMQKQPEFHEIWLEGGREPGEVEERTMVGRPVVLCWLGDGDSDIKKAGGGRVEDVKMVT